MLLVSLVGSLGVALSARVQSSMCLTARDAVSKAAIASALVRVADERRTVPAVWTDTAGKACWSRAAGSGGGRAEVMALGYRSAQVELRGADSLEVPLAYLAGDAALSSTPDVDAWQRNQMVLAVLLARRELDRCGSQATPSCAGSYRLDTLSGAGLAAADVGASAEARDRLSRAAATFVQAIEARMSGGASPPSPMHRDSASVALEMFLDTPDAADRYVELRLTIPRSAGHALFGATEMACRGTDCDRTHQVSVAWEMTSDHRPIPTLAMLADGATRSVDVFHLLSLPAPPGMAIAPSGATSGGTVPAAPTRSVVVRGVVRDEKGQAVPGVQISASPGDAESRTDSAGHYAVVLRTSANAIVLSARALGYAPTFRTTFTERDTDIVWEPQLRRFQLLAARVVTGKGVPAQLSSWRYDELMARRAEGRGFFLVGNEISSSNSIGDALSRAPGLIVKMKYSNTITALSMSRCTQRAISGQFIAPGDLIGVWVNGIEQTLTRPAESVLGDLMVAEVIALEVYNGASMIPAEFTSANYCGVVSAWTR